MDRNISYISMLRAVCVPMAKLFCENVSPFCGFDPPLYSGGEERPRWNFRLRVSPSRCCTPLLSIGGAEMQPGGSHETKTSAKTAGGGRRGPYAGRGACGGSQSVPGDGRRGARGGIAGLAGAHPPRVLKGFGGQTKLPCRSRGRGAA